MENSTTIKGMLAGNEIFVPAYQRAYSWETETDSKKQPLHVNTFVKDLENHVNSQTLSPYYFGHFLFEKKTETKFAIIDGQQRLTTIIIFLSSLFHQIIKQRNLTEDEEITREDTIIRKNTYRFKTVDYDNDKFKDYVIDKSSCNKIGFETTSIDRIATAADYFANYLSTKTDDDLCKLLHAIQSASCTTHQVLSEAEAIQMFIFQNNRGKKPSNLEIIKAQFMFYAHLKGGEATLRFIENIKNKFETIYKCISSIEYSINEDEILLYTLRTYFNSLWEENAIEKINNILSSEDPLPFINSFTQALAESFSYLKSFFGEDERNSLKIHSLITLGGLSLAIPFIIKAYSLNLEINKIETLCSSLESIILRNRLIGTRADITSRLNDEFKHFTKDNPSIQNIIDKIETIKSAPQDMWWLSYWNNNNFERSLQGKINPSTAKYILWKYEIHLLSEGKKGYEAPRYSTIQSPELEHISPQTENTSDIASGYSEYNEEFRQQYLDCLGNYLLLSKSHNCSSGNKAFHIKRASYSHLAQQREIQQMSTDNWTKSHISKRKTKIISYLLLNF